MLTTITISSSCPNVKGRFQPKTQVENGFIYILLAKRRQLCYNKHKLTESNKVNDMKRILALTLSLLMLLTLAVGCGEQPEELTNSRISADLAKQSGNYSYAHIGGTPTISQMTITEKTEENGYANVEVSALATFEGAKVEFTATMAYELVDNRWKLRTMKVTDSDITLTGAPDQASVLNELSNYISTAGNAMAVLNDQHHLLTFNVKAANWEMQYEDGADTATLNVKYTSKALSFEGYYTLTFGEQGWSIETIQRENDRNHPLLHLTKLEK